MSPRALFFAAALVPCAPEASAQAGAALYDASVVRTLRLDFYDADYDATLDERWLEGDGARLPARATLDGTVVVDSVGVRYKGNSTYALAREAGSPKLPLNIDLDAYDGSAHWDGITKLKLANAWLDPTFAREVLAYDTYGRFLPSPRASLVRVYLGEEYLGLYVNTESVAKPFLRRHYASDEGAFFKCDPAQQYGVDTDSTGKSDLDYLGPDTTLYYPHYALKSDAGWGELRDLIAVLDDGGSAEELEAVLNVDRLLWGFAANMVVNNLDAYNGVVQHNYYLYRAPTGRWQYVPWDVSESWTGAFLSVFPPEVTREYNPFGNLLFNYFTPLMLRINFTPEYRRRYAHHLRVALAESPDSTALRGRLQALYDLTAEAVAADTNRAFTTDEWRLGFGADLTEGRESGIAGLLNTHGARRRFLATIEEISAEPPVLGEPELDIRDDGVYVTVAASGAVEGEGGVRLFTSADPRAYASGFDASAMRDDGTGGDLVADDGVYAAALPGGGREPLRYFVRADDDDAMATQPPRAEYAFYRYAPAGSEAIVINELAARNDATLADEAGEFDDWIELHNPTDAPVNVGGLLLSDNPDDPARFTLPTVEIGAGDYLIVWADGDTDQGALHAPFRLSGDGESLTLRGADGAVVDEVTFPNQYADISWGRLPNATGPFARLVPTPGAPNKEVSGVALPRDQPADLTLAPNPAHGWVDVRNPAGRGLGDLRLVDVNGRTVRAWAAGERAEARLELAGVAPGAYALLGEGSAGRLVVTPR